MRDAAEMPGDAISGREQAGPQAFLGVVRAPEAPEAPSEEMLERLRSLGYVR